MKRSHLFAILTLMLSLSFTYSSAFAGDGCQILIEKSNEAAAKDKGCKDAKIDVKTLLREQKKRCKAFRKIYKKCKMGKHINKLKCNKKKPRKARRACRKKLPNCQKKAKKTNSFKVCKDSRKLTRKMKRKVARCFFKHYGLTFLACAAEGMNE